MEVSSELHSPAALLPREWSWYRLERRLGEPESQFGCGGEYKKTLTYPAWNRTLANRPVEGEGKEKRKQNINLIFKVISRQLLVLLKA
jgi:hypothetical protein